MLETASQPVKPDITILARIAAIHRHLRAWSSDVFRHGHILRFIAVLMLLHAALLVVRPGGSQFVRIANDLLVFAGPLMLLPFCMGPPGRVRAAARLRRGQWTAVFFGLGIASYVVGQIVWAILDISGRQPFPSVADIAYLSICPFLLAGILLLPSAPDPIVLRLRLAVESVLVFAVAATGAWYFVLGPLVVADHSPVLARGVACAYLLSTLLLTVFMLVYAARPESALPPGVAGTLAIATVTIIAANATLSYQSIQSAYQPATVIDLGWPLGYMLLALAAGMLRRADIPAQSCLTIPRVPALRRMILSFLGAMLLAAIFVALWINHGRTDANVLRGTALGSVVATMAFMLRQLLALIENRRLLKLAIASEVKTSRLNAQLQAAQDHLQTVYDAISCGVVVWDAKGRVIEANAIAQEHTGLSLADLRAAEVPAWLYYLPDGTLLPESERPVARVVRTGQMVHNLILRLSRAGADDRWMQISAVPVFDEYGTVKQVITTGLDITKTRVIEESLLRRQESFDLLFAASPQPMWVYDLETLAFLVVNDAAVAHYGYAREEFLRLSIADIRPKADVARLCASIARPRPVMQRSGEWRHLHRDGRVLDVEIASHRLQFGDRPAALVIAYDITERKRAFRELAHARDFSDALLDTINILVIVFDAQGRIIRFNHTCELVTGYTSDDVQGRVYWDFLLPPDERDVAMAQAAAVFAGADTAGEAQSTENHWLARDGTMLLIRWSSRLAADTTDGVARLIATGFDITQQRATERAMAHLSRQHAQILASAGEGIFGFDRQGYTTFANPAAARMLGYEPEELIGQVHHSLIHHQYSDGRPYPRAYCRLYAALSGGVHFVNDEVFWRKDGTALPIEYTSTPIWENDQITGAVVTFTDITARKQAEAILAHQVSYDALTDLPNRTYLRDQLNDLLLSPDASIRPLALLLLDLDHFKEVNDTLGHHTGDLLLVQVSRRLQETLPGASVIARLGGDEFAILLSSTSRASAGDAARLLLSNLGAPFEAEGQSLAIGGSIGIALCPEDGTDRETLLRHADVAMYAAKRAHAGFAFYDAAYDLHSPERLALLRDLRRMLDEDQLCLYYQPKVSLHGEVLGVEALARWIHPTHGLVRPDVFIPLAEQTGMIEALTARVIDIALCQSAAWRQAGLCIPIAINLSTRSLHDQHFPEFITTMLRKHGVAPGGITLEITEGSLMVDPAKAQLTLTRLHNLGIRLAIDDFGTGYSSLAYLRDLPVDEVKVDKSFVMGMQPASAVPTKDAAIVRSVIAMAHELSLEVVAEGVEDRAIWNVLVGLGCDIIQGYYISRPLPARELEQWLSGASAQLALLDSPELVSA